jgi:hypothetical protein
METKTVPAVEYDVVLHISAFISLKKKRAKAEALRFQDIGHARLCSAVLASVVYTEFKICLHSNGFC